MDNQRPWRTATAASGRARWLAQVQDAWVHSNHRLANQRSPRFLSMMRRHSWHNGSGYSDDPRFVASLRSALPQPLNVTVCTWSPGHVRAKPSSKPDGAPQIAVRFLYVRPNWHWSMIARCAPDLDAQDLNAMSFNMREPTGCSNV